MTLEQIATIKVFQGLESDLDDMTDLAMYPLGSKFKATDTGKKFIKRAGDWVEDTSGPISEQVFDGEHSSLRQTLRSLMEEDIPENKFEFYPDSGHYNFLERR